MKQMFKLAAILAAYTVIACVGLALVYNVTKPMIDAAKAAEVRLALTNIFPEASDFTDVSAALSSGSTSIKFEKAFVAVKDSDTLGLVIQVTGPTYASATLLVAVDAARQIRDIVFITLTDTAGLGTKVRESAYIGQYPGKPVDSAFTVGTDIQAVSGATISSRGVAAIVKLTAQAAGAYLESASAAPGAADADAAEAAEAVEKDN